MENFESVTKRFIKIVADRLELDDFDVKPASNFIEDLGADSLALLELVIDTEDTFDLDIPDEDVENMRTVQDALDYLKSHVTTNTLTMKP